MAERTAPEPALLRVADAVADALRLAAELRDRGVRREHRVLVCTAGSVWYPVLILSLIELGVSIVPVDPRQVDDAGLRLAAAVRADHVLDDAAVADLVAASRPAGPSGGEVSVGAWRARPDAVVAWSSGSTGRPRGVLRSGASILDNTERTRARMRYRDDDVLLPLLPFSHQYGLSLLLLWWRVGCGLIVTAGARVDVALELAQRHGATVVDAAPATYHTLLNLRRKSEARWTGLRVRMWCVGGSPLDPALAERFHREVGAPLLDGYGATETGNIALATLEDPRWCGRPLDGVQVRVQDADGTAVPAGHTGEIVVISDDSTVGHYDEQGEFHSRPAGPLATGDIGRLDDHGRLQVLGRRFAVHRMGYTLYPEAIGHDASECGAPVQVVALPDTRTGSRLVFVVADPEGRDERYWRGRIHAVLPEHQRPNRVIVTDEFPVTVNGKPDRDRLTVLARGALRGPVPAGIPFPERVVALHAVADFLRREQDRVQEVLTTVSPHRSVQNELAGSLRALSGAAEEVARYRPGRVGRLAAFMPSNLLCYSYVLHLLIPALFTEQLVHRPSTKTGEGPRRLHELLAPVHGLPIELSELSQQKFVAGPVGEADVVVFTGTYANAEKMIRPRLRPDQLLLYFGQGVNPFVVAPGADLHRAVTDAIRIRLLNSGQDCFGPDLFLVSAADRDQFLDLLVKQLGELRYGPYTDRDADYGPLCYESALADAVEFLRRNRGRIHHGGQVDLRHAHLQPTVLVRTCDDRQRTEEIFSPIFDVVSYRDQDELRSFLREPFMIDRAMAAMLYGEDPDTAALLARRHQLCRNQTLLDIEDGNEPFGGAGIEANYIAHRGRRHAEPLLLSKAVAEHLGTSR